MDLDVSEFTAAAMEFLNITPGDYQSANMNVSEFDLSRIIAGIIVNNDSFFNNVSIMEAVRKSGRDSVSVLIPMTICYFIIFIAGLLGNVITCTVISRNKCMHTATNYYLFNLAISDLLLLVAGELRIFYLTKNLFKSMDTIRAFFYFKIKSTFHKIRNRSTTI